MHALRLGTGKEGENMNLKGNKLSANLLRLFRYRVHHALCVIAVYMDTSSMQMSLVSRHCCMPTLMHVLPGTKQARGSKRAPEAPYGGPNQQTGCQGQCEDGSANCT